MARRNKKKVKNDEEEAKDRLSDLPDSLLLHILSFLPETRLAVQTCVLSKRWKCLWTSLPDLIFCECRRNMPSSLLKKIARKVLSGRNNLPVGKLCFSYRGLDKALVTRVINYAISHNVQHFSISVASPSLRILFPLFNRCHWLKTLELGFFDDLFLLRDIRLPTLTTLHISYSTFYDSESTDDTVDLDPFVGLVNLKSLKLVYCEMLDGRNFKISGPQLHSLTINEIPIVECFKIFGPQLHSLTISKHNSTSPLKVEIFAPKLHSFQFIDTYPVEFSNLDFPLLETADVDVNGAYIDLEEKSHLDLINMFQGLYHAQSLHLSSRTIEFLMKFPSRLEDQASPFARLKTLNVRYRCNPLSMPDTLINYFVRGPGFSRDISIEIKEEKRWLKR